MEREVILSSGGKDVPLNDFARAIVANTIVALVGTLKKSDADGEIAIRIGPAKK